MRSIIVNDKQTSFIQDFKKAKANLRGALKDKKNPFFNSNYADLNAVMHVVDEAIKDTDIIYYFGMDFEDNIQCITLVIAHPQQEAQCVSRFQLTGKDDPQGRGSAITYARRYLLSAFFGVKAVDDDGEAAMPRYESPFKNKNERSEWMASTEADIATCSTHQELKDAAKDMAPYMKIMKTDPNDSIIGSSDKDIYDIIKSVYDEKLLEVQNT